MCWALSGTALPRAPQRPPRTFCSLASAVANVSHGMSYLSSRYLHPSTSRREAHDAFQGCSKLFSWLVLRDLRSSSSSNTLESGGPACLEAMKGGTASRAGPQLLQNRGCSCLAKLGITRRLNPSTPVPSVFLFFWPLFQSIRRFGVKGAGQPSSSPARRAPPLGWCQQSRPGEATRKTRREPGPHRDPRAAPRSTQHKPLLVHKSDLGLNF